jgi:hypothetical protein
VAGPVLLMRVFLHRHKVEVKYFIIGAVLLGGLILLERSDVLGNLDHTVVDLLDATKGLGIVGMFLVALVSNCAVFVQVPYTLPLLSAAIGGNSLGSMLALGAAAGVGAGCGEIIKYHIAHKVLSKKPHLHRSKLYQWILTQAHDKPRHVKWIVFGLAASVLPDDTVIIPLALIKYPIRRIAVPLFTGKVIHNLIFAGIFYAISETAEDFVKHGLRVDLAFGLIVTFLLVIAYQVEKALHHEKLEEAAATAEVSTE